MSSHDQCTEEDYIDIDPDSMSTSITATTRRNSREFEFKLCPNSQERCSYDSPADELFYKGILLPLQLHPRIQTIQRLLSRERSPQHSIQEEEEELEKESMITRWYENDGYRYSTMPVQCGTKNSWSKKFKGLGGSSLCSKLKASRTYLKSLFVKPTCSNEWCDATRSKGCANGDVKRRTKIMLGKDSSSLKSSIEREKPVEEDELIHRKSLSSVTQLRQTTGLNSLYSTSTSSSSSSSSSFSSSDSSFPSLNLNQLYIGLSQPPALRRSSSVNSEIESSIQGAITYCKKSQNLVPGRKSVSSIGFYSF